MTPNAPPRVGDAWLEIVKPENANVINDRVVDHIGRGIRSKELDGP